MLGTLFLVGALVAGNALPAELPPTPRFRHYGVSEGLPSSRVYTAVQDHTGYIWVGTGDGLARFDGERFLLYRHEPQDPDSLPANDVSALLVDRAGRLWAGGGRSGLNRLQEDGSGFRHWMHDESDPGSLSGNDVMAIAEGADGRIWVGVYAGGLNRLRVDGSGFDHLAHLEGDSDSLASDNVLSLRATGSGRLWVGTDKGIDLVEPDGQLRHIPFAGLDAPPWVWQIAGDDGDIRLSTSVGLFRIGSDAVARRWPGTQAPETNVFASLRDRNGDVWVATRGSLRLRTAGGEWHRFDTQPMQTGGLPARVIVDIEADSDGGLWLASGDAGLLYLSPDWREFSRFTYQPGVAHSLRSSRVMALGVAADGQLLAGGLGGKVDRLDPTTGAVQPLSGTESLPATSVLTLEADAAGRVWIGMQRGLYLLEGKVLRKVPGAALEAPIRDLLQIDGALLVAPLGRGMLRVDSDTLAIHPVALGLPGDAARQTRELVAFGGWIWRASEAGLARMAAADEGFVAVDGVARGRINALDHRAGTVWLARPDALERYSITDSGLQLEDRVTAAAGFPAVEINRLFIDTRGRVWMTSRVGLFRFDPGMGTFRRYDVANGLPSPEFSGALVRMPDGAVFAGTFAGIAGFRPTRLLDHARQPTLALESISVLRGGHRVPLEAAADGSVRVNWDEHAVRVVVKGLSYINPERNRYRFRMHDFDERWVGTGNRGVREFTGLTAGRHALDVQAAGASGVWTTLPQALVFEVAAPPWRTPAAWAIYGLAVVLLLGAAWRMSRTRLRRRLELELLHQQRRFAEDANEAKSRFLATMGHEIRTPMTGVLGMAELLTHTRLDAEQTDLVGTIRHSGELLLKLVNDALDMARIEAGKLELDHAPLDPVAVMREVVALEAGLATAKGIDVRIEHAEDVPARVLGDAIRLRQILLNLTSNALKFTAQGAVTLSLQMRGDGLCYRVSDTGPGMEAELQRRLFRRFEQGNTRSSSGGSGLGLAICRELVQLMGGSIEVSSEVEVGSVFTVVLPLPSCAAPASAGQPQGLAADTDARRTILLVEDDTTIAKVLSGLLQAQGHAVTRTDNALAALAELDGQAFDTLLVDIDLPDLDGLELVRMLRARPASEGWYIVVVTARSNRSDEADARAAGADAFVRKPVSGEQLRERLERKPGA